MPHPSRVYVVGPSLWSTFDFVRSTDCGPVYPMEEDTLCNSTDPVSGSVYPAHSDIVR